MNKTLALLLLTITSMLLVAANSAVRTTEPPETEPPQKDEPVDMKHFEMGEYNLENWNEITGLADAIGLMPAWDKVRLTDEEQKQAIRIAYVFQHVDPETVSDALLIYMGRIPVLELSSEEDAKYQSKPMILLRILFDLPIEPLPEREFNLVRQNEVGGFKPGYNAASLGFPDGEPVWRTWWYPIEWQDDRPQFYEGPRFPIAGQNLHRSLQPHRQFNYMHEHFQYRDLRALFSEEFQPEFLANLLSEADGEDIEGFRYADYRRARLEDK